MHSIHNQHNIICTYICMHAAAALDKAELCMYIHTYILIMCNVKKLNLCAENARVVVNK